MKSCPNVNSVEWKNLVEAIGEGLAWVSFYNNENILEIVDTNLDSAQFAQQLGLQNAEGTTLGKTKSLLNKLESTYLNASFTESKRDGKYYYEVVINPLESREYYEQMFKNDYPNTDEYLSKNDTIEEENGPVEPELSEEVTKAKEQADTALDELFKNLSSTTVNYLNKLNNIRKTAGKATSLFLNNALARVLVGIQNRGNVSIDSFAGKALANMFDNLENPTVLRNFINNNGLTQDFLKEDGQTFMDTKEILNKMFDLNYLNTLTKSQQQVLERRGASFIEKIAEEIQNVPLEDFVKKANTATELYNNEMVQESFEDVPNMEDVEREGTAELTDNEIMNMPEFLTFNDQNPNTSIQENLEYFKKCKL